MLAVLAATICGGVALKAQQQAVASDSFADSVGVCVHLHNGPTLYYKNYPLIKQALLTLGVRHIREGLIDTTWQGFYDRLNDLGDAGITGLFITDPKQSAELLKTWPDRVSRSFEAYENPNEYDGWLGWADTLLGFGPTLYGAARGGVRPDASIVGPSFKSAQSFALMGNMTPWIDYGNLHNYYAGRNPGSEGWGGRDAQGNRYGSIPWSLDLEREVAGDKPVWITETGYTNQTDYVNYVTEEIQAVYTPRLLLEHWIHGVHRTYIYELLSSGKQDFGLMRSDGTPKPAYAAVSNLLNLLADRGPGFTPDRLDYTLQGAGKDLHQLLLEKRDGTFYLALWVEAESYDPDKHVDLPVSAQKVTLQTPETFAGATTFQWTDSGAVNQATLPGGMSFPLTVTDRLLVVQLQPSNGARNSHCSYSLAQSTATFPVPGGAAFVPYTAGTGCNAQPQSSASWLQVTASNGALQLQASANQDVQRSANVSLGNATLQVVQDGLAATGTLTSSANSMQLGSVGLQLTSSPAGLTLSNRDTSPARIQAMATTAQFQAITGNGACAPGLTLPSGASCDVWVTFTPAAAGTQTGSLRLTTGAGSMQIPLTGTGIDFTLAAVGADTVTINAGATATFNLQLTPAVSTQQPVAFACDGAPTGVLCMVEASQKTLTSPIALKVTLAPGTRQQSAILPFQGMALAAVLAPASLFGLIGRSRRKVFWLLCLPLILSIPQGCGTGVKQGLATYTVRVAATGAGLTKTAQLTVNSAVFGN